MTARVFRGLLGAAGGLVIVACGTDPLAQFNQLPLELTVVSQPAGDSVLSLLTTPLAVQVRNASDEPLSGLEVHFLGGGRVTFGPLFGSIAVVVTDHDGRASVPVRLGGLAGEVTIDVVVPRVDLATSVSIPVSPGLAASLLAAPGAATVYPGAQRQITARVADQYGNPRLDRPTFTAVGQGFSVDGSGLIRAGPSFGSGVIRLALGSLSDSVFISVVPRGRLALDLASTPLAVQDLDGSNTARLYAGAVTGAPTWSPSGLEVVVPIRGQVAATRLFRFDLAGRSSPLVPMVVFGVGDMVNPAFSADGQWVFFTGANGLSPGSIWRTRVVDGVTELLVAGGPGGRGDIEPSPSPDGRFVVFERATDFSQLIVLDLESRTERVLADGAIPRWSPAGNEIAFADPVAGEVVLIRPDGTDRRTLTSAEVGLGMLLAWSPDANWLLFGFPARLVEVRSKLVLPLYPSGAFRWAAWQPATVQPQRSR